MRLIDADALHYSPRFAWTTPDREEMVPVEAVDRKHIEAAPTVAVQALKTGEWEEPPMGLAGFLRCSVCRDVYIEQEWLTDGKWNFCPSCGARLNAAVEIHNVGDCKSCKNERTCPYHQGQHRIVRINCPLWRAKG